MKLSIYNVKGDVVGDVELNDAVFGVDANVTLMHQAVVQHLANRRVGTADTKTRAEIRGTTKKMYKQKGTGRARHGSRKVNLWIGGGVAHGPHPRSYEQHMPKKMRRAAVKSALSAKARDNQIVIIDELSIDQPSTKAMMGILAALPINGKILLTTDALQENVRLSTQNIPRLRTCPATSLNTYDILNHEYLVATVPALRQVEAWLTTARRHGKTEPTAEAAATTGTSARRGRARPAVKAEATADDAAEAKPARAARTRKKDAAE